MVNVSTFCWSILQQIFQFSLYYFLYQIYILDTWWNTPKIGIPEFMDPGRKSWTLGSGRWTLDAGHWTLHARLWTLDSGCWTLDSGRWTLDAGLWMLDSGCWTLDGRLSMLDVGRWTLDVTLWTLGIRHCALSLTVLEQNQKPVSDSAGLNYWKFFGNKSLKTSWSRLFHRDYRFWCGYF